MVQAFIFKEVAITVRHWYEVSGNPDEEEHGVRLEVRRLKRHPQRGTLAAPQLVELDEIIWRADLFDLIGDEPGSFSRAHHHTNFAGIEPQDRAWDEALSAHPFDWTEGQLGDVGALARTAGFPLDEAEAESEDVRRHLPQIMAAAQAASPANCQSPRDCRDETREAWDLTLQMLVERRHVDAPHDLRVGVPEAPAA